MNGAVIVVAARTPIGKHRGALSQIRPDDLMARTFGAAVEREDAFAFERRRRSVLASTQGVTT